MRKSWDEYFLGIAREASTRSTCDRLHVGAVVVRGKMILATGYNGSIRGLPHCDDVGHLMIEGSCKRTVHAEQNAVAQAARAGTSIDGATLYCTHLPCRTCFSLLANAGIVRVIYSEPYKSAEAEIAAIAGSAGILLDRFPTSAKAPRVDVGKIPWDPCGHRDDGSDYG